MEKLEIKQKIMNALDQLNSDQQERLWSFLKSLIDKRPKNNTGILELAGTIDQDDLKLMEDAIQEGCEKINPNEW